MNLGGSQRQVDAQFFQWYPPVIFRKFIGNSNENSLDFQEIHWILPEDVKGSKGVRTDMNEQISTEKGPSSLVILGFFAINKGNLKFQRLGTVKACSHVFRVCFFLKHGSHLYLLESWLTSWIMSSLSPRTNTTFCAFAAAGDCL